PSSEGALGVSNGAPRSIDLIPQGYHDLSAGPDAARVSTPNHVIEPLKEPRNIPANAGIRAAESPESHPAGRKNPSAGRKQEPLPREAPPPSPARPATPLAVVDGEASADDLEQQTQLHRRAEQVLGKPEYGLIRQLINTKGSIAGARSVVEAASET